VTVKTVDPRQLAFWRYEQIQEALDERLHPSERGRLLRQLSKVPVRWPSGVTKPIALATLYRWLDLYAAGGLEALQPRPRSDRGTSRTPLAPEVIDEALRLLSEDDCMSYTFLLAALRAKFPEHTIARSTLHRQLSARPEYGRIQRARKKSRRRTRFVAKAPHDIWHTDAKGPVSVRLVSGVVLAFHILSILDDATRAVLAAIVALAPDLAAAVRAFRIAALRWGLPNRLYADRAGIFDSKPFRMGLALLGAHRIATKPRNPEAHGKIEAYHRALVGWFTKRLPSQRVVDLAHLQLLLDGVIAQLYQVHPHRGLGTSPEAALAGVVSPRAVPPTRLYEAFRQERRLRAHPKTGEVDIQKVTYLVPDTLRGNRLTFLVDPVAEIAPVVVDPWSGEEHALRRAAIRPGDVDDSASASRERWGEGPLQAIYDNWRGQRRPLAESGFGLPEIYQLLSRVSGRHVPASDSEAALVQRAYRQAGPFSRAATEAAMEAIDKELGPHRPIKTYLEALVRRSQAPPREPDGGAS
jgi:putative transposase